MSDKRRRNERGISLVEIIIVLVIGGLVLVAVVPKGIEAMGKSKSNALQEEFSSIVSAFTTLDNSGGSSLQAIKATIKDAAGNLIMKDYIIPVAPSAAFNTITTSEVFRRDNAGKKPLVLTYGFNEIGLTSEITTYKADFRHTGNLTAAPASIGGTLSKVVAVGLSAQGATGIAPIFSLQDSKLLEDFIKSPNGLDFAEYVPQMVPSTDVKLLALLFGGTDTSAVASYMPYDTVAPNYLDLVIKRPVIQLTVVDVEAVKASSSGSAYSTIVDTTKGTLYQVTGIMSRADFTALYNAHKADVFKDADVNTLYDKISNGFSIGTPVFVPHREKDIIKSTVSDLKYGYYRP